VTSQSLTVPLIAEDKTVGHDSIKGIEFLDVFVEATYTGRGALKIETSVFRKQAAADLYILASSYHSWQVKAGMVKGEAIRYLISVPLKIVSKRRGADMSRPCARGDIAKSG
jgi:hypothetical protein